MVAKVYGGLGAILSVSTNVGSPSYTAIANVVSIDGPKMSVSTADTTNLGSTAKTYRGVICDGGEQSFVIQFDPADSTQTILLGLIASPALAAWKLTFTDSAATAWTFQGILTGFEPTGLTVEGNVEANCSVKISGQVTT